MPDLHLKQAVQSTLISFLEQRRSAHDDIAQDVFRTFRDEAALLLERELIFNCFDSDPFGMMKTDGGDADNDDLEEKKKNTEIIARVKELLRVVSCTRTATADGYSFIQAIVQIDQDKNMQGVNDNVRLHFSFLRDPQHFGKGESENADSIYVDQDECCHGEEGCCEQNDNKSSSQNKQSAGKRKRTNHTSDTSNNEKGEETLNMHQVKKIKHPHGSKSVNHKSELVENPPNSNALPEPSDTKEFKPKTIISYKVEYSVDYGKFQKLFGVDIYASGDVPSVEEAVPLIEGCDDESSEESGDEGSKGPNGSAKAINSRAECVNEPPTDDSDMDEIEMLSDENSVDESIPSNVENGIDADRFGAYVEPENIVKFLDQANMNFDEKTVFYFLLMFPFYEHEWDVSGFLLSSLFDDDQEEEEGYEAGNRWGGSSSICVPCSEK
eukprot:CCRYP_013993-RA/>CCRYP_013993-RA protein AED:0.03 eAED:0.03 QI:104/1/1/1/1/1/2/189/438